MKRYLTFFFFLGKYIQDLLGIICKVSLSCLVPCSRRLDDDRSFVSWEAPLHPGACISLMMMMTDGKAKVKVLCCPGKVLWSNIVCTRIFLNYCLPR